MTFWVLVFIAEMLEVKGTLYFFDTFMEKRDGGYRNRYRFFVYCGVLYLAAVTGIWIGMLKCILIILVMSLLNLAYYEVSFRQSFLFSIINYTMLVLIDYVTVLLGRGGSIQEKWFLQALISKTAFIILMLFIRRFSKTRKSYGRSEERRFSFSVFLYLRWSVSFLCFIQKTMICRMYFYFFRWDWLRLTLSLWSSCRIPLKKKRE